SPMTCSHRADADVTLDVRNHPDHSRPDDGQRRAADNLPHKIIGPPPAADAEGVNIYLNPRKNTPSIAAGLDGDEFRIAGVSLAINSCYIRHSSLKLKFGGSGRKSAG